MPRSTILFLAANPVSTARVSLDEEARDIEQKLLAASERDAFDLKTKWAVRPSDLQEILLREQPTVVHFSGHGAGTPGIVLHSEIVGEERLVTADALKGLFSVLRHNIRVVVLNACHSEEQAKAIVEVIDFVIGMKRSIGDEAARAFAVAFYRGLGFGKTVRVAFDLGVNAIKLEGLVGDDVPILLIREGVAADQVTFGGGPAPATQDPASLRSRLRTLLHTINPEVLRLVDSGESRIKVMIATLNEVALYQLNDGEGFDGLLRFTATGAVIIASRGSRIGGYVHDLLDGMNMNGYLLEPQPGLAEPASNPPNLPSGSVPSGTSLDGPRGRPTVEAKMAKRRQFLEALYDATDGNTAAVADMWELGTQLGLTREETSSIVNYLDGRRFLGDGYLGGGICLSHQGVQAVEETRLRQG